MTKRALVPVFRGQGQIAYTEHEWPDPGPGQLLIRVRANAICGTDREQFLNGSEVVAGHEAAGEVAAAGQNTSTPVGTRGVIYFKEYCGSCRSCAAGHTSLCSQKRASTGMTTDGGYGPWELIAEQQFFAIPDDVPFDLATMLLDAMGTTGHAWKRALHERQDVRSVYIAGAGPIGLGLLLTGRLILPADIPIYVSDFSEWRRNLVAELGGHPLDAADEESIRAVGAVDLTFDSTGKKVARQLAIDLLGNHGVFMVVGGQEGFSFDDVGVELLPRELSILGSEYFDYNEFAGNLDRLQNNRDAVRKLLTHTYPVEQLDQAFATFLSGESGKVVVTQGGAD
ncbi:propanol-preferring alcohol dehydrogenase [Microbacterium sp. SLBN-154]|uniref:alcohol dehydrogenase catalytic domain-containing protein n=1 Tax=Microbacterium sp. SLBN-154 TaxID=2768458 RepID=UPI00114EF24F|nr:alcohol dehydrogenase catalytic domain-containing protein [Microbacterium sp. SLBN-154]TQK17722.1 propanol-preferring alcohol dehydrogenase [Microbacterium sp. SLBN-154]